MGFLLYYQHMKKRIFIALPLPESVIKLLTESQQPLVGRRGVHVVQSSKLHATLLFLGEVGISDIPKIKEIVQEEVSALSRVSLSLADVGGFPSDSEATIVHVSFREPASQPLKTLRSRLWNSLAPYLDIFVLNEWSPHITIARSHEPVTVRELNLKFDDISWNVESIELWQSSLGPTGTEYSVISTVKLN